MAIGHTLTALVIGQPIEEVGRVLVDGLDFGVG